MTQHPPNIDLIFQLIADARETLRQRRADEERALGGSLDSSCRTSDAAEAGYAAQRQ